MTRRILTLTIAALLALGLFAGPLQAEPASSRLDADVLKELAQVRRATAKYHNVEAALADGYEVALDPVTAEPDCVEHPGSGGMGFHYVKGSLIAQGDPDPLSPAILVYAPRPNGSLQLVAVEYASWNNEEVMFGKPFSPGADPENPDAEGPPFATLHAWVWKANPNGLFAPFNPNVSC